MLFVLQGGACAHARRRGVTTVLRKPNVAIQPAMMKEIARIGCSLQSMNVTILGGLLSTPIDEYFELRTHARHVILVQSCKRARAVRFLPGCEGRPPWRPLGMRSKTARAPVEAVHGTILQVKTHVRLFFTNPARIEHAYD